jgi:hypothetical protein
MLSRLFCCSSALSELVVASWALVSFWLSSAIKGGLANRTVAMSSKREVAFIGDYLSWNMQMLMASQDDREIYRAFEATGCLMQLIVLQ